ncbi:MAG: terminase large subunit, partial [Rikenellaceae bacterium]|nr:terminase large subunit [Rikenellaceae bacterium]
AVVVGRWVELLYERIIGMLERKEVVFDQGNANRAIEYIETRCHHTEGELAPSPLKLELWQKAFVSLVFGIVDENGRRQFREVVLLVGRKNGKSALAAAIGKYIFEQDGGFGTRVYCLAPKLDQAEIIYNGLWTMFLVDPLWNELDKEDPTKAKHRMTDLFMPATNSTVKKIAFSAKKSDGFNPSLTICDEVASWQGANGLKQYEVMKSGMGARPEGLLLSCTTSGYENDGIFDELVKRSTRYLLGDSKERKLLPLLYMIDDVEKWNDINELRKSNPNLGVSVSVDYMLEEIAIAEGSISKKIEFLTKYCNIKQNSSAAWLSTQDVERMCGAPLRLEDFAETYAVCGIDLSQTRDLTACTLIIERGGEFYVFAKFFLPSERIDECTERDGVPYNIYIQRGLLQPSGTNFVDYHDCYAWLTEMVERYHIFPLMVGYDRYSAQYLVQELNAYGFRTDDVFQGENLWGVLQEMEGYIADGKIHIGDNDLLKIHLLNSAIKMSNERGRGKLIKISPSLHIDGTAALSDAFTVRQKYYQEIGEQLKNEG